MQIQTNIQSASRTVDIELEKPIDLSNMIVRECSVVPFETFEGMKFSRVVELRGHNDDHEELIITIKLNSKNRPNYGKD